MTALDDAEMLRLAAALTGKHLDNPENRGLPPAAVASIVHTTVADVTMVIEGSVTIEDYEPPGGWVRRAFVADPPVPVSELTDDELRLRLPRRFGLRRRWGRHA